MFGYVKADTPELRVRENEYYRALYCGLCKAQGKCTGQCSRFTLSYDMTFLATVRMALLGVRPEFRQATCIAHPLKKRNYALLNSELCYCAYASSILAYGKCLDDIADERGLRRVAAYFSRMLTHTGRRRALDKRTKKNMIFPYDKSAVAELDAYVLSRLRALSEYEKSGGDSVDIPADIFGDIMERIASFGLDGNNERIMRTIGRHLGRWVYITDAADDMTEDAKKGRYNPFVNMYFPSMPTPEQKEAISDALKVELAEAEIAFDLIDYDGMQDMHEIVNNIIYLGMPKSAKKALCGDDRSHEKHKNKAKKGAEL